MRRTYCLIACFVIVSTLAFSQMPAHSAIWQSVAPLNTGRDQFAGGVVDGKIYVFGGNSRTTGAINSTEMFDPAVGRWVYVADGPYGVEEVSGAGLNGKFYVFGGVFWWGH